MKTYLLFWFLAIVCVVPVLTIWGVQVREPVKVRVETVKVPEPYPVVTTRIVEVPKIIDHYVIVPIEMSYLPKAYNGEPITKAQVLDWLAQGLQAHQYYLDHPEGLTTDRLLWEKVWVGRYEVMYSVVNSISDELWDVQ